MSYSKYALLIIVFGWPAMVCNQAVAQSPCIHRFGQAPQGVAVFHATFQQRSAQIQPKANHVWRHTQDGWQQIPMDPQRSVHLLEIPVQRPRIHPFSVASLTLLLALAAMAWSSTEWDWQRFTDAAKKRVTGDDGDQQDECDQASTTMG